MNIWKINKTDVRQQQQWQKETWQQKHKKVQLQQFFQRQGLANLTVPLSIFYGSPTLRVHLITHCAQTMNVTQKHIIHTYNNKGYKYIDRYTSVNQ